jgi:hypothetical protein
LSWDGISSFDDVHFFMVVEPKENFDQDPAHFLWLELVTSQKHKGRQKAYNTVLVVKRMRLS